MQFYLQQDKWSETFLFCFIKALRLSPKKKSKWVFESFCYAKEHLIHHYNYKQGAGEKRRGHSYLSASKQTRPSCYR